MLFNRRIAPSCAYCRHGSAIGNGEIACVKRGIMLAGGWCKKFSYDPIKREPERLAPPPPVLLPEKDEEAFVL
ncbi:MAG TPA: hypothetical protein GXZ77_07140 [Papillibacter sp.]|jgi:hypothetical protein|nr:hypothetical protein [Papillibacter sp.]